MLRIVWDCWFWVLGLAQGSAKLRLCVKVPADKPVLKLPNQIMLHVSRLAPLSPGAISSKQPFSIEPTLQRNPQQAKTRV